MTQKSSKPRFLPEISVAGAILVLGALWWKTNLAPPIEEAPGLVASEATDAREAPSPSWDAATPAQRAALSAPITAQIQAFSRGDFKTAITFQSANLRRKFASAEQFGQMMKSQYPQFIGPKSVQFGKMKLSPSGQDALVAVNLVGRDGVKVRAVYRMAREKAGFRVGSVEGGLPPVPDKDAVAV